MARESDWRLTFAERLRGQSFRWKHWFPYREGWDHDHCAGCGAPFCAHPKCKSFKEGYAVTEEYELGADYEWVCKQCFEDLRDDLDWKIISP